MVKLAEEPSPSTWNLASGFLAIVSDGRGWTVTPETVEERIGGGGERGQDQGEHGQPP